MTEKKHGHSGSHEAHHAHRKKGVDAFMIATIILAVLLIVSIFTAGFGLMKQKGGSSGNVITATAAADKGIKFINTNLLKQGTAVAKNVTEEKGLYKMTMLIDGKEYESYITKDGGLLFPSAIDVNQVLPVGDGAGAQAGAQAPSANIPKSDKPKALLFTMTYCPYGNQAEDGMFPALKALGSSVSFEPHYVIYANYQGGGPNYCLDNGKYCSMHGIQELNQGVRELCLWKYDTAKFFDFVAAVNTGCTYQNVDSCWEGIAASKGVDTAKIKKCYADEALTLLASELALNQKYGVQGSPQLIINEAEYQGGRAPENYKSALCAAMNTPAAGCNQTLSVTGAAAAGGCAT